MLTHCLCVAQAYDFPTLSSPDVQPASATAVPGSGIEAPSVGGAPPAPMPSQPPTAAQAPTPTQQPPPTQQAPPIQQPTPVSKPPAVLQVPSPSSPSHRSRDASPSSRDTTPRSKELSPRMDPPPEPLILITTLTLASSGRQDDDEEEAIAALSLQKAWRYVAQRIGGLIHSFCSFISGAKERRRACTLSAGSKAGVQVRADWLPMAWSWLWQGLRGEEGRGLVQSGRDQHPAGLAVS